MRFQITPRKTRKLCALKIWRYTVYIQYFISFFNLFVLSGGVDYGYFPTSEFLAVTLILADETEVLYPILIRDDDIIENVESFNAVYVTYSHLTLYNLIMCMVRNFISLQISDDTGTIILGAIHEAIIYIEDNDSKTYVYVVYWYTIGVRVQFKLCPHPLKDI